MPVDDNKPAAIADPGKTKREGDVELELHQLRVRASRLEHEIKGVNHRLDVLAAMIAPPPLVKEEP